MVLEPKPGTYALILSCSTKICVQIGRLGTMQLQPGYYIYLGSALGPGGLRARIAHHQKPSLRPHWHIDYLRAHTRFHSIWFSYDSRRREHQWARVVRKISGREGSSPRVRSLRLQLSVASLLLQALPVTDQLPARSGIFGQATPSGGGVLAWQVESGAHLGGTTDAKLGI